MIPFDAINEGAKMSFGIGQSIHSMIELDRLNKNRPQYEKSPYAKEALARAKAKLGDPNTQATQMYSDSTSVAAATAYEQMTSPTTQAATIQATQQRGDASVANMMAQQEQQNWESLKNALIYSAQLDDAEWQINTFAPFKDEYQKWTDWGASGMKTASSAGDNLAGIGDAWMTSSAENKSGKVNEQGLKDATYNYKKNYETTSSSGGSSLSGDGLGNMISSFMK